LLGLKNSIAKINFSNAIKPGKVAVDFFLLIFIVARCNHSSLIHKNHLYIYGGVDANRNALSDFWVLNVGKVKV